MSTEAIIAAARAARAAIVAREAEIEGLDRAIGDGDHYINVSRGAETVVAMADALSAMAPDAALKAIGIKLMSTVGGASGPLISSFFLAAAKVPGVDGPWTGATVAALVRAGVEGIKARGKADVGHKTMLDVLIPLAAALEAGIAAGDDPAALRRRARTVAQAGMESTRDLVARYGRAAFLGERARGHVDPGAMSSYVIVGAVCDAGQAGGQGETP